MKKNNKKKHNIIIIVCLFILVFIVSIYLYIFKSGYDFMNKYSNRVYPDTYISGKNISNMSDEELSLYLVNLENKIQNIKISININEKNYNYKLQDLGIYIDKEEIISNVLYNSEKTSLYASIKRLFNGKTDKYNYKIIYSQINIKDFVNNLKKQVDIEGLSGELKMTDRNLSYEGYKEGYSLDKEKLIDAIETEVYKSLKNNDINDIKVIKINASGKKIDKSNKDLSSINKKVATFATEYFHDTARDQNLKMALNSIDKVVVMPGEEFSFFDYAGPYNKEGYLKYDDMIGNGVCQVSTTLYNALLLMGIKATDRSVHSEVTEYVAGGLDAMVASNGNESLSDFKFKNTLSYPIYISAYLEDNFIKIDIWSNEDALLGRTYKSESVKRNNYVYDTYLYTIKDNQIINKEHLATNSYIN